MVDNTGPDWEMPGGGYDFQDVFDLFAEASQGVHQQTISVARDGTDLDLLSASEMEPEGLILMDGFTLQDAMSALEVRQMQPCFGALRLNRVHCDRLANLVWTAGSSSRTKYGLLSMP